MQPEHAQLDNLNVEQQEVLITPEELKSKLPVSESVRLAIMGIAKRFEILSTVENPDYSSSSAHVRYTMLQPRKSMRSG